MAGVVEDYREVERIVVNDIDDHERVKALIEKMVNDGWVYYKIAEHGDYGAILFFSKQSKEN